MIDYLDFYLRLLDRCSPERLVRDAVDASMPRDVVAIGKCAGALLDGVAAVHDVRDAFVAIPRGYRAPRALVGAAGLAPPVSCGNSAGQAPPLQRWREIHEGGHPEMTRESFEAGRALLAFVDAHEDILFLISGGGSACVEVALPPHTEDEVAALNHELIASGKPIAEINAQRKRVSAIKGGKLGARVKGRAITLVYSDVAKGRLEDVASGPTEPTLLIADNTTLVRTAATMLGLRAVIVEEQLESDVEVAARELLARAQQLESGQVLVAGGEPTVKTHGDGKGGRCSELAVRFVRAAIESGDTRFSALFASSDGVDGNSGAAGVILQTIPNAFDRAEMERALATSNSMEIAAQIGEPIMIAPTGNNLRDVFLVARD